MAGPGSGACAGHAPTLTEHSRRSEAEDVAASSQWEAETRGFPRTPRASRLRWFPGRPARAQPALTAPCPKCDSPRVVPQVCPCVHTHLQSSEFPGPPDAPGSVPGGRVDVMWPRGSQGSTVPRQRCPQQPCAQHTWRRSLCPPSHCPVPKPLALAREAATCRSASCPASPGSPRMGLGTGRAGDGQLSAPARSCLDSNSLSCPSWEGTQNGPGWGSGGQVEAWPQDGGLGQQPSPTVEQEPRGVPSQAAEDDGVLPEKPPTQ